MRQRKHKRRRTFGSSAIWENVVCINGLGHVSLFPHFHRSADTAQCRNESRHSEGFAFTSIRLSYTFRHFGVAACTTPICALVPACFTPALFLLPTLTHTSFYPFKSRNLLYILNQDTGLYLRQIEVYAAHRQVQQAYEDLESDDTARRVTATQFSARRDHSPAWLPSRTSHCRQSCATRYMPTFSTWKG